nr:MULTISPECIES: DUF2103 domain-containing protein [unclassified Prochlorococcus]
MGRLVLTHSSYVEGLISLLKKIVNDKNIKTITPGAITRVKGKSVSFKLVISREVKGGYKLNARKGRSAQEVYILTDYSKIELTEKIESLLN